MHLRARSRITRASYTQSATGAGRTAQHPGQWMMRQIPRCINTRTHTNSHVVKNTPRIHGEGFIKYVQYGSTCIPVIVILGSISAPQYQQCSKRLALNKIDCKWTGVFKLRFMTNTRSIQTNHHVKTSDIIKKQIGGGHLAQWCLAQGRL